MEVYTFNSEAYASMEALAVEVFEQLCLILRNVRRQIPRTPQEDFFGSAERLDLEIYSWKAHYNEWEQRMNKIWSAIKKQKELIEILTGEDVEIPKGGVWNLGEADDIELYNAYVNRHYKKEEDEKD